MVEEKGNTVEETTTERRGGLITHALYNQSGVIRIAIDDEDLMDLNGSNTTQVLAGDGDVELVARPGSEPWVRTMVVTQRNLKRDLEETHEEVDRLRRDWNSLGEAILEKADKYEWCDEYDEFAKEWNLPTRHREYEVTIDVRVMARSEDDAVEFVKDHLGFNIFDEEVVSEPNFEAGRV